MDDLECGIRDSRGNWAPHARLEIAPFWTGSFHKLGSWIVSFLWPWNVFHMVTALGYWFFIIPDVSTLQTLSWNWALWLFAINAIGIFVMYGAVEFFYYFKRKQQVRFKYNARFPADCPSEVFWFKSQNLDNFIRTYLSSIPLWTLCQVLILWAWANGWGQWVAWETHWPWLIAVTLLVPAIHEIHFFCIHRLLHAPFLYKWVHSVHHNSVNPSPWSSLSMHPIEGFLYFAEVFWHLLIPSNPIVMMFQLNGTGYGAINGHIGFDKLEISDETAIGSHAYVHYLHHKYFDVNYGADGIIPLDYWFGYWHDGSKESDEQMKARFLRKKELAQAKKARSATIKERAQG